MNTHTIGLLVACALLAGCASASPPARKPAPPMPREGVPADWMRDASLLMPPMPVGVRKATVAPRLPPMPPVPLATFRPAAVTNYVEPMLGIYPFGVTHYLVVARQAANSVLEMQWADSVGGSWNFLAGYGWTPEDQYVSAAIPSDWLPYHRMFVTATNSFSPMTPAWAKVKSAYEIYTNHKLNIKGTVYRLVEISPPGTQFRMYRLIK